MKHRFFSLFFMYLLSVQAILAQEDGKDYMRSTGKIYVVVAVLAVIFIVLIGYLVYLDRKSRRLEKQIEHGGQETE